jgi:non-specific protein-tyrosine kinase
MDRSGHQTLLVVGCVPESGSTTAITNLAAASAASGKRVLIVDANFRRSRLADVFEVDGSGPGLGDILCDFVTLEETILDAGQGVHVMPAGTEGNRIIERLNNGRLDTIIAQLRARYDLVIFDAPPAVVAGDAMIVANKVDAAILVVRANREHRGLVGRLLNGLLDAQCEVLGLLLNRPRGTVGGYFKENFEAMASYTSSS